MTCAKCEELQREIERLQKEIEYLRKLDTLSVETVHRLIDKVYAKKEKS